MDFEIEQLERVLVRIPGVTAVRVGVDGLGRATEVHVLATRAKHPKQLVRDVQSAALAACGVAVDHRIVSVVQLDDDDIDLTADRPALSGGVTSSLDRILLEGVGTAADGLRCSTEVALRRPGGDLATGTASGISGASMALRWAATATLAALRQIEPAAERVEVEAAGVLQLGARSVVVVSLVLVDPPGEEVLLGTAAVGTSGPVEATVRATLDATNRRLAAHR